jgi:hypothetical protein
MDSCNPVLPNVAHSTASHPEISFAPEFCSAQTPVLPDPPKDIILQPPPVAHGEEHRLPSLGEQLETLLVIVVQRDAAAGLALRVLSSEHKSRQASLESSAYSDLHNGCSGFHERIDAAKIND